MFLNDVTVWNLCSTIGYARHIWRNTAQNFRHERIILGIFLWRNVDCEQQRRGKKLANKWEGTICNKFILTGEQLKNFPVCNRLFAPHMQCILCTWPAYYLPCLAKNAKQETAFSHSQSKEVYSISLRKWWVLSSFVIQSIEIIHPTRKNITMPLD